MQLIKKTLTAGAALTLWACASAPPVATKSIDPVERERAEAALDVFQDLAARDEWYAVLFAGEPSGHLERTRTVRDGEIRIVTTVTSDSDNIDSFTIVEHFDAGAPHDATLLEVRDADGNVARIVQADGGYVAEALSNGILKRDTLFDFRFRLADLLAAEIWVSRGADVGDCLSYPGYSLKDFSREFYRECIIDKDKHRLDGQEVDAVRTRLNGGVRIKRLRESGMELITRESRNVEVRLVQRAISTQGKPYAAPPELRAAQLAR